MKFVGWFSSVIVVFGHAINRWLFRRYRKLGGDEAPVDQVRILPVEEESPADE
jgi:hypothetical protein